MPLVFPLLAGAGAFTTLLSLRAEYASVNIIIALVLNMIWVYFVVSMTGRVERFLGKVVSILFVSFWYHLIGYFCKVVYGQYNVID